MSLTGIEWKNVSLSKSSSPRSFASTSLNERLATKSLELSESGILFFVWCDSYDLMLFSDPDSDTFSISSDIILRLDHLISSSSANLSLLFGLKLFGKDYFSSVSDLNPDDDLLIDEWLK